MASSDPAALDLMGAPAARTEVPLADQWSTRIEQHRHETYAGVPLMKFPEDLRTYERILWETNYGQSADPVEYSMPYASDTAAATLRKYKKSATVTLTVKVTGAGGYHATLVKTAKLAKG